MGRGGSGGGHASGGGHSHGGGSHGSSHSHGGGRGGGYRPSYRDDPGSGGYRPYYRRSYGPGGFDPIRMGGPGSSRGCLNSYLTLVLVVVHLAVWSCFTEGGGQ